MKVTFKDVTNISGTCKDEGEIEVPEFTVDACVESFLLFLGPDVPVERQEVEDFIDGYVITVTPEYIRLHDTGADLTFTLIS
jgi:hypothetical protein